ncbi:Protein of unknown function [Pyronema omphalodes CBS 100304]|uniref:Uncharacterized protein n=1 Tax=Pyronema omphalodes (strain CBS 100304) TaxID=1076935 RepID=U4L8K2_PYROM|nr:Protein of unknown function [Pyronema omphalodes CBS 100304]
MSASAPRETPAVEDTLKKRPSCCCCCYHYNKFDIAFAVFRYLEIALGVWTIALCVIKQVSTGDPDLFNLRRLANTSGPLIPLGVLSIVSGVLISGMGCCTKQAGVRFPLNRPRLITEAVLQSLILTISLVALPAALTSVFLTTDGFISTFGHSITNIYAIITIVAFLITSALCFALDIYILEKDRHFRREAKAGNLHLPGEFVVQGEGEEVVWWNGARWDQPQ